MNRFFIWFLLIIVCSACNTQAGRDLQRWENHAGAVEIIRDDYGIAHIYGRTDADAVFGMLYAQCEDDFRRVERNYIWAIGRLAELEGKESIYSDVRANLYMTEEEAKAAYKSAPEWLQKLCEALADGINYYLHTHPDIKPFVITRYEPWFPMFFSEGSIGGDIEQISTRKIAAFYEKDAMSLIQEEGQEAFNPLGRGEPRGSNGIAIAGSHSGSGHPLLLINPHTTFYFRPEIHVVSEEGLNAYGAVTWGQFFIYQGFNEKTGWMHTSSRVDFIDEFIEDIHHREGKLQYRYGNEWRDVEVFTKTLKYVDTGELKEEDFTMYRTHHGPITHLLDGKWVATKINWDPVNALIQSFNRTKTHNYEEFRKIMNIRSNSSNNTVFADAEGNIAYFHGNFIPKRNPGFDFSQPVDGSDPASDWQGLHTVDECITILNPPNGWIQNCNSTPFTAAGTYSPRKENYPLYMAPDPENFRGIHAVRLLEKVDLFDPDQLIALAYHPDVPAFEKIIPPLIRAIDRQKNVSKQLKEAAEILRIWNFKTGETSVAMTLAHFYGNVFIEKSGMLNQLIELDVTELYSDPVSQRKLIHWFEEATNRLVESFGTWNVAWGDINRLQRLSGDIQLTYDDDQPSIPIGFASGRWGALASYGSAPKEGTKKLYGTSGNSFVAVVEFGEKVSAKSILAGGQNSHPQSPHFFDQAHRYAQADFKEVAFYRDDVIARARETYMPGRR